MIITGAMAMQGLSSGLGFLGGMFGRRGADKIAKMKAALTARGQDLNYRSAKEGTLAGMGMNLAAFNNDALAQSENKKHTQEMALWGAGELANRKSQSSADHAMRMLGVNNSEQARTGKAFENYLNASGAAMTARAPMAGMFGDIGSDRAFKFTRGFG